MQKTQSSPPARRTPARSKVKKPALTARTADRHQLYQLSVQAPEHEVTFMEKTYRKMFRRKALRLREDFCGTGLLCAEWVKSDPARTATGVDISAETLAWGRRHNIEPLGPAASRVTLLEEDVRAQRRGKFDIVNALNFSYWVFRTRSDLVHYFSRVRKSLADEGFFLLDAYGGWESQQPMLEPRKIAAGFTYVWDQDRFCPITHAVTNYIHFEFKDGTKLEKAFTYEWRFWTLPEIRELLLEAGFTRVDVHWDVAADDEEEKYEILARAENQPGWLAYIVASMK